MTGFEFVSWYGLWGPKDMPADLTAKLQTSIAKVLAQPDVKQRLSTLGFDAIGSTPDYFANFIDKRNGEVRQDHSRRQHQSRITKPQHCRS